MKPWYEFRNQSPAAEAEIWIYDEIGEDFWAEGVTAKAFVEELNAITAPAIALHINSPGGSVFDGQAIYTALRRHPATITSYVDGVALSIASVVALGGDRVIMPRNALMMIHDPWGTVAGYSADMRRVAEVLDTVRETILNVYDEHSLKTREEISAAMTAETWFTADDAYSWGFVDEITAELQIAAQFDLSRFRNAPFLNLRPAAGPPADDGPVTPAEGTKVARPSALPPCKYLFRHPRTK